MKIPQSPQTNLSSPSELESWLERLERMHPAEIELGLERVRNAADRAGLLEQTCPLITVGGTNGKGSVVAYLTAIFSQAGYKVGSYTSPHILRYNERICINAQPVSDKQIVKAFEVIERARGEIPLTYFEVSTLAALSVFNVEETDVVILEVGLGGRLDAVNILDADVSIVTSIGIDHESWLGDNREVIAIEKAGIARQNRPLVTGDHNPPHSLLSEARRIGARLRCIQRDFDYSQHSEHWVFRTGDLSLELPPPALVGQWQFDNAAVAIMSVLELSNLLPVTDEHFRIAMTTVSLAGRYQRELYRGYPVVMDVGHNPAAVERLVGQLLADYPLGVKAVFAIMADKAVEEIIGLVAPVVKGWYLASLDVSRALPAGEVSALIAEIDQEVPVFVCDSMPQALDQAVAGADPDEPVFVFGSFFTLSAVAELID